MLQGEWLKVKEYQGYSNYFEKIQVASKNQLQHCKEKRSRDSNNWLHNRSFKIPILCNIAIHSILRISR